MSGDFHIWTQMKASNVENLLILADYLELQVLLDQCIVWILKEMFKGELLSSLFIDRLHAIELLRESLLWLVTTKESKRESLLWSIRFKLKLLLLLL